MQATSKEEKEEKEEQKTRNYVPMDESSNLRIYNMIKGYEGKILHMVAFSDQSRDARDHMETLRRRVKEIACKNCTELNQFTQSEVDVKVLVKSDFLTVRYEKLVLMQEWQKSDKRKMSCEDCRVLRDKQIATGFIKGRRFKQV